MAESIATTPRESEDQKDNHSSSPTPLDDHTASSPALPIDSMSDTSAQLDPIVVAVTNHPIDHDSSTSINSMTSSSSSSTTSSASEPSLPTPSPDPAPAAAADTVPSGSTSQSPQINNDEDEVNESGEGDFDCNICMCPATEPVITRCGHLYCWSHLWKWMEQPNGNECPVCKAGITRDNVIPLYGRGSTRKRKSTKSNTTASDDLTSKSSTADSSSSSSSSSASAAASDEESSIPNRPSGERPEPLPRQPQSGFWSGVNGGGSFQFHPFGFHGGGGGANIAIFGFGVLPALLSFAFSQMHGGAPQQAGHPQQQSTFGNMMLLLGILVIFFLIYS